MGSSAPPGLHLAPPGGKTPAPNLPSWGEDRRTVPPPPERSRRIVAAAFPPHACLDPRKPCRRSSWREGSPFRAMWCALVCILPAFVCLLQLGGDVRVLRSYEYVLKFKAPTAFPRSTPMRCRVIAGEICSQISRLGSADGQLDRCCLRIRTADGGDMTLLISSPFRRTVRACACVKRCVPTKEFALWP